MPKSRDTLDLSDIVKSLEFMEKLPAENKDIHYFSYTVSEYICCGRRPLPANIIIPFGEFPVINKAIQVRIKSSLPSDTFNLTRYD